MHRFFLLLAEGFVPFWLGTCWFSFANTAARRYCAGISPWAGRSRCPACGAVLGPAELIPVVSWLFLRGRCRHCRARIPLRELLVELAGGAAALLCRWRYAAAGPLCEGLFGLSWAALLALFACGLLLAVSLVDAQMQLIPDFLVIGLGLAGLLSVFLAPGRFSQVLVDRLAGALCVSVPLWLLGRVYPGCIGAGDCKFMAAAGLLLGWAGALTAFLWAVVLAGLVCAGLLLTRRVGRGTRIALGPYLAGGTAAMLLFGGPLLQLTRQIYSI